MRALSCLAVAAIVWLAFGGVALVNYDTLYGLLWGRELWEGMDPDLEVRLAPTQHPLLTAFGVALAPLATDGVPRYTDLQEAIVVGGAYLLLGAAACLTFALGRAWFGAAAGALAALIVITREPMLSYGLRAYVDVPFVVLVLAALLVETRRPRAGRPVLVLLGAAGLLRPEAWLFSALYAAWLLWDRPGRERPAGRRLVPLVVLAAAGPLLWALSDLVLTGDPLFSLTGTREGAEELERVTGLGALPETLPRRLGEIVREPVLVGAAGGGLLALWRLRTRATLLGAAAGVAGAAAFAVLAAAGLSLLTRYLLFPAVILALFCGAGVFGWRRLPRSDPWRRRWAAFGAVVVVLFAVFVPAQVDRLDRLQAALARQEAIVEDLEALFTPAGFTVPRDCFALTVPNRRAVPYVALWTGRPARAVGVAQDDGVPRAGLYFRPSSRPVARAFILDPRDRDQRLPAPPPEAPRRFAGSSWTVWGDC